MSDISFDGGVGGRWVWGKASSRSYDQPPRPVDLVPIRPLAGPTPRTREDVRWGTSTRRQSEGWPRVRQGDKYFCVPPLSRSKEMVTSVGSRHLLSVERLVRVRGRVRLFRLETEKDSCHWNPFSGLATLSFWNVHLISPSWSAGTSEKSQECTGRGRLVWLGSSSDINPTTVRGVVEGVESPGSTQ